MSIQGYLAAAVGGFLAFFFLHYLAHRLAHNRIFKTTYEAHATGHHLVYIGDALETEKYQYYKNHNLIDFLVGLPSAALLFFLLPTQAFLVIIAEALVLWWLVSWIHISFHIKNHWLNNYAFFREAKRLHFLHHYNMKINFGFLVHLYDRIFFTFKTDDARAPRPPVE